VLGLHPGPSFGVHLIAAACGVRLAEAQPWVDELSASHLVNNTDDGRYRLHDLIRLFAHQCGLNEDPPAQRAHTVARIVDWYVALAHALDPPYQSTMEIPVLADRHSALNFLDTERNNMVPVAQFANDHGTISVQCVTGLGEWWCGGFRVR
jgi:hypothetical protein